MRKTIKARKTSPAVKKRRPRRKSKSVSIIPLGGVEEIGKNITLVEYDDEILVVDAGIKFPDEEMLGIDLVIPDITYLLENKEKIVGIVLTHGHEDHIGALPYILKQVNVPCYGTKLTLGLAQRRLEEHGLAKKVKTHVVKARDKISLGKHFEVEFLHVTHSIADAVGLGIRTPAGLVVHTGDFKIDQTPVDGRVFDYHGFADFGDEGVLVLMSDSTNVEREGHTLSESCVRDMLDDIIRDAKQRLIIASFSSNIHRIQQVLDVCKKYNRKVAVSGMSMEKNIEVASRLGYLDVPKKTMISFHTAKDVPHPRLVILTTGSQGEPRSALTRMATGEHKQITISKGDTVVISAKAIPGNERPIGRLINHFYKRGAEVFYERVSEVHVSGHGSRNELRTMLNLIRPKYFVPVHGEYRHLIAHSRLAQDVGIPEENIFIPETGNVLTFGKNRAARTGTVTAGSVLVDGNIMGDEDDIVLRDRRHLAQDGMIIVVLGFDVQTGDVVTGPDIISRGFAPLNRDVKLYDESLKVVLDSLAGSRFKTRGDWGLIKADIRADLRRFFRKRTDSRPMILPIIMEV